MKFHAAPGKRVRVGRQRVVFDQSGALETDDKEVIAAMDKARGVTKVTAPKAPKPKPADAE